MGHQLLPQASRNLHLPTNLASSQRPRRALWSNPFSITKHSHPLHPKAKRDASQNRPQPSTTIKNYQANLFARDFAAPFVQPLAKSPPIWPASAFFPFRPPAFFLPLLRRIPPPPQPQPQPRDPSISISHLSVASHRIAKQGKPAPKGRPAPIPRPRAIRLFFQRDTVLLCIPASTALRHPGPFSSILHNPDTPFGLRLDAPLLPLILSAILLGLSFTLPCFCYSFVIPSALLDRYALNIILGPRGKTSISIL